LGTGLQEGEIKLALQNGGYIRNVLVISKRVGESREYLAYFRPSWRRELLPLRTWQDKADRLYRDLNRLLVLIRDDFAFQGVVPLYVAGDPDLARYKALAQEGRLSATVQPDLFIGDDHTKP
jgi:hypothetical protein